MLQPWTFCPDLSEGKEAQALRAIIDRPADLLATVPVRRAASIVNRTPIVPRVLPPWFKYEAKSYQHVTQGARWHLDRLYRPDAPLATPKDMWSGCEHTRCDPEHLAAFSRRTRVLRKAPVCVRDPNNHTPVMECLATCDCGLARCVFGKLLPLLLRALLTACHQ